MLRENNLTTLYVNGVAISTGLSTGGNAPTGNFTLGQGFQGTMDRARFFTFTPGSFSAADLITPLPEPASFALIGFGLAALGYVQHRKRRA
jgi:hypothetical protein